MSDAQQPINDLQTQQIQLVRDSLIVEAFKKYHELINFLKKLPIPQGHVGMQKAFLDIDTGMLWVREILNTCNLVFAAPEKKEEPISSEEKPIEESEKPQENRSENPEVEAINE